MKLNVEISKKIGLPNYGSSSATVGIVFDAPDSLGEDIAALRAQLVTLQGLAHELVEDHLLHQVPGHFEAHLSAEPRPAEQRPASAPRMSPVSTPEPPNARVPAPREDRPISSPDRRPRSGADFYGWLKDRDKEFGTELLKHVVSWAKLNSMSTTIREWDHEHAGWGFDEASRVLAEWKRRHQNQNQGTAMGVAS